LDTKCWAGLDHNVTNPMGARWSNRSVQNKALRQRRPPQRPSWM